MCCNVIQSDSQTVRQSDSQTVRQSDSQTVRQSDSQTVRQSDSQTVRQSDSQTVRQSDSQTVIQCTAVSTRAGVGREQPSCVTSPCVPPPLDQWEACHQLATNERHPGEQSRPIMRVACRRLGVGAPARRLRSSGIQSRDGAWDPPHKSTFGEWKCRPAWPVQPVHCTVLCKTSLPG